MNTLKIALPLILVVGVLGAAGFAGSYLSPANSKHRNEPPYLAKVAANFPTDLPDTSHLCQAGRDQAELGVEMFFQGVSEDAIDSLEYSLATHGYKVPAPVEGMAALAMRTQVLSVQAGWLFAQQAVRQGETNMTIIKFGAALKDTQSCHRGGGTD